METSKSSSACKINHTDSYKENFYIKCLEHSTLKIPAEVHNRKWRNSVKVFDRAAHSTIPKLAADVRSKAAAFTKNQSKWDEIKDKIEERDERRNKSFSVIENAMEMDKKNEFMDIDKAIESTSQDTEFSKALMSADSKEKIPSAETLMTAAKKSKEDLRKSITTMVNNLETLKKKTNKTIEDERSSIQTLRECISHLSEPLIAKDLMQATPYAAKKKSNGISNSSNKVEMKNDTSDNECSLSLWESQRQDRMIIEHLCRCGCYTTALQLAEQSQVEHLLDKELIETANKIETSLMKHDTKAALDFCEESRNRLKKAKSTFYDELRRQEFIELARQRKCVEAVKHARKYFTDSTYSDAKHLPLMGLLVFPPPSPSVVSSDINVSSSGKNDGKSLITSDNVKIPEQYIKLYSEDKWMDLVKLFRSELVRMLALSSHSVFAVALQLGLSSLKTVHCYPQLHGSTQQKKSSSSQTPRKKTSEVGTTAVAAGSTEDVAMETTNEGEEEMDMDIGDDDNEGDGDNPGLTSTPAATGSADGATPTEATTTGTATGAGDPITSSIITPSDLPRFRGRFGISGSGSARNFHRALYRHLQRERYLNVHSSTAASDVSSGGGSTTGRSGAGSSRSSGIGGSTGSASSSNPSSSSSTRVWLLNPAYQASSASSSTGVGTATSSRGVGDDDDGLGDDLSLMRGSSSRVDVTTEETSGTSTATTAILSRQEAMRRYLQDVSRPRSGVGVTGDSGSESGGSSLTRVTLTHGGGDDDGDDDDDDDDDNYGSRTAIDVVSSLSSLDRSLRQRSYVTAGVSALASLASAEIEALRSRQEPAEEVLSSTVFETGSVTTTSTVGIPVMASLSSTSQQESSTAVTVGSSSSGAAGSTPQAGNDDGESKNDELSKQSGSSASKFDTSEQAKKQLPPFRSQQNPDCPVCTPHLNKLAQNLPYAKFTSSKLLCPLSGTFLNEHNHPMMLPNGYVYGYESMKALAQENDGMFTCPQTGEIFSLSAAQKLFIV